MEFGLFMELSVPRPWTADSERQVYENALEQVRLADELGFDYIWAVEHHFLEEYSHCSGPDIFLSAAATMTKRIRVGHGVVACVPQYQSPIRVAERAAVLDIISGGRLELGTGRSATWPELSGFGANPDDTKKTWDEFVRVIPKMWMQERFAWNGRMFSMPERAILPKPLQKPHPPMWVAVTSPGTEIDAADRGLGCLGLSPGGFADSEKKVLNYRKHIETCDPVGAFVNDKVLTVNFLSCCEDGDLGRRNGLKVASMFCYMAAQLLSAKEVLPTHSYPSEGLLPALRRESGSPGDAAKAFKGVTMGTPDDVADAIAAWENVGFDGINFIHQFMEVVPQQYVLDSMRLFAEEVMPRFKTGSRAVGRGCDRRDDGRSSAGSPPGRGWPDAARRLPRHPPSDLGLARGRARRRAALRVDDVDILQVLYEVRVADREALVPPALNPTIPPVICFLVYRAKDSAFGPFALAQLRLTARSGVRPRAYLISARCDNPALSAVLARSWGFRVTPGEISLRRFHDRVDCTVSEPAPDGGRGPGRSWTCRWSIRCR